MCLFLSRSARLLMSYIRLLRSPCFGTNRAFADALHCPARPIHNDLLVRANFLHREILLRDLRYRLIELLPMGFLIELLLMGITSFNTWRSTSSQPSGPRRRLASCRHFKRRPLFRVTLSRWLIRHEQTNSAVVLIAHRELEHRNGCRHDRNSVVAAIHAMSSVSTKALMHSFSDHRGVPFGIGSVSPRAW